VHRSLAQEHCFSGSEVTAQHTNSILSEHHMKHLSSIPVLLQRASFTSEQIRVVVKFVCIQKKCCRLNEQNQSLYAPRTSQGITSYINEQGNAKVADQVQAVLTRRTLENHIILSMLLFTTSWQQQRRLQAQQGCPQQLCYRRWCHYRSPGPVRTR
jgi:hypothetical protein